MAKYITFRKSGKYYTEGEGVDLPINAAGWSREEVIRANHGKCPGHISDAADMYIVVYEDDTSFPRLFPPVDLKDWLNEHCSFQVRAQLGGKAAK